MEIMLLILYIVSMLVLLSELHQTNSLLDEVADLLETLSTINEEDASDE